MPHTIRVTRPAPESIDVLGITCYGTPVTFDVGGVIVQPADVSKASVGDSTRERRPLAALVLHVPKSCDASLSGCSVELLPPCPAAWAGSWDVVGDPMPLDPALTPGPWNREVRVERASA